jgi:hypothetical protein
MLSFSADKFSSSLPSSLPLLSSSMLSLSLLSSSSLIESSFSLEELFLEKLPDLDEGFLLVSLLIL